jgi:hypothetical protein
MKIKNRFGNIKPFNLFKQQRKFGFGGSGAIFDLRLAELICNIRSNINNFIASAA